jgi:hypothetical protein
VGDGEIKNPHPGNEKHIQIQIKAKLSIFYSFFFNKKKYQFSSQIHWFKTVGNGNHYLLLTFSISIFFLFLFFYSILKNGIEIRN